MKDSFAPSPVVLSEDLRRTIGALREYLNDVGFVRFHKYLISPALYLFEQPLSDVDAWASRRIREYLHTLRGRPDVGSLLATSDPRLYYDWGHRFIYMSRSKMVSFFGVEKLKKCEDEEIRSYLE